MEKDFYVSPFIEMEGRYTVHVQDEPSRLRIAINERPGRRAPARHEPGPERRRLTDRTSLRMLVRHPFVTQKTIGLIHWHALRLWRARRDASIGTARSPTHGWRARGMSGRDRDRGRSAVNLRPGRPLAGCVDRRSSPSRSASARRRRRIRIGRLTVVMPDGRRRVFGDRPRRASRARSTSTTSRRRSRMLLHGETGAGEAYVDGLWSVAGPRGLLELGGAQPRAAGPDRRAGGGARCELPRTLAHRARRNTKAQARRNIARPLRPGQRLLPAVPRRDHDLLERGLRCRRTSRWRTPSANKYRLIAEGAGLRAGDARPGDRLGLGRVRALRRRRARLPGHVHHDLEGAARPRAERVRAAGLEDRVDIQLRDYRDIEGTVRRDRLDRDARSRRAPSTTRRSSRPATGRSARRQAQHPGPSRSPMSPTRRSAAARTGSRRTSSRAACARRWRSSSSPSTARGS